MAGGFRTIGHSNRSLAEFTDILQQAGVGMVADVRRFPRSRNNPAFNNDSLPDDLERCEIGYRYFPDLGGRRNKSTDVSDTVNAFWRNRSFHNYADYAMSDQFARAFDELVELGQRHLVAIMCSEAVWWRCHRRIITDYLLLSGYEVIHLMGNGRQNPANPTQAAELTETTKVVYPAMDAACGESEK